MENEEKTPHQKQIENIARAISTPRIDEQDKEACRVAFAGNEELIVAIRNLFFGYASAEEKDLVRSAFKSEETLRVVRKIILPVLDPSNPFKQSIDLWQTFDIEHEDDERVASLVQGRKWLIEMLEQALGLLENPDDTPVDIDLDNKPLEYITFARLKARNTYISHIESQCVAIVTFANSRAETPEEARQRRKLNSNK